MTRAHTHTHIQMINIKKNQKEIVEQASVPCQFCIRLASYQLISISGWIATVFWAHRSKK